MNSAGSGKGGPTNALNSTIGTSVLIMAEDGATFVIVPAAERPSRVLIVKAATAQIARATAIGPNMLLMIFLVFRRLRVTANAPRAPTLMIVGREAAEFVPEFFGIYWSTDREPRSGHFYGLAGDGVETPSIRLDWIGNRLFTNMPWTIRGLAQ